MERKGEVVTFIINIEVTGFGKPSIGPSYDRDVSSTRDKGTHFIVPSSEVLEGWDSGNAIYKKQDPED